MKRERMRGDVVGCNVRRANVDSAFRIPRSTLESHCHVRDWIAPIAVARQTTYGPRLHGVGCSRSQVRNDQPGLCKNPDRLSGIVYLLNDFAAKWNDYVWEQNVIG